MNTWTQSSDTTLAHRLDTRHTTLDNLCSPHDTRHLMLGLDTHSSFFTGNCRTRHSRRHSCP
eukprot:3009331-Rhodomonas_salina.1